MDAGSNDSRPSDVSPHQEEGVGGEEVMLQLRRVIRAIDLHSKKLSRETGLTTPQLVVLQAIRDSGEVTTGRVSSAVSLSQATVTTILDRLEDRGLIERYRSSVDRRIVHSRLTAAGKAALRKAPPLLDDRFRRIYGSLSPRKQAAILDAMREIADMMGTDALDTAPLLDSSLAAAASRRGRREEAD